MIYLEDCLLDTCIFGKEMTFCLLGGLKLNIVLTYVAHLLIWG